MKLEKDGSLIVSDFSKGIGQSVLSDYSDVLGVNLEIPGVAGAGYKFNRLIETKSPIVFALAFEGADYFDLSPADTTLHYAPVKFSTTGTLPVGINTTDVFYLWDVNGNGATFRICEKMADVGSSYIDFTGLGTGVHSFTRVTPEQIDGYTFDSNSNLYLLDDEQRVWFSQSSVDYKKFYLLDGNTSSGNGNGIIYYAGYIIVFGSGKLDALAEINDLDDTLVWDNDFASAHSTISSGIYPKKGAAPFYSKYDNAIYFGNGNASGSKGAFRVGLLEVNVGETFDPTDTGSWSLVPDAIEIPYASGNGYVQCISESGENLIFGTGSNTIYYWDRKSILPYSVLEMPENNTTSIINKGSSVFAFNGYNGKFYIINSTDYGEVLDIPEHLFGKSYLSDASLLGDRINIEYTDAKVFGNEILFAIEVNGKVYLMSYNVKTKALIKKNISSYGETLTDSASVGRIYQVIPLVQTNLQKNNVLISTAKRATGAYTYAIEGWQYGTSNYHQVYDNDTAYITTGLLSVGDIYNKKTFRELQVSFLRPLTTGQGVKIYYRGDDSSAFTLLKTIDYATYGAIKDIKVEAPMTDVIDLQIKAVINGYNGATTGTSPMLKLVRLIP